MQILFTTDTALSSKSAGVRSAAVSVIGDLISLLPLDVLKNNIAVLMIGLYPIIEQCGNSSHRANDIESLKKESIDNLLIQLHGSNLDVPESMAESDMLELVEQTTTMASEVNNCYYCYEYCMIKY